MAQKSSPSSNRRSKSQTKAASKSRSRANPRPPKTTKAVKKGLSEARKRLNVKRKALNEKIAPFVGNIHLALPKNSPKRKEIEKLADEQSKLMRKNINLTKAERMAR